LATQTPIEKSERQRRVLPGSRPLAGDRFDRLNTDFRFRLSNFLDRLNNFLDHRLNQENTLLDLLDKAASAFSQNGKNITIGFMYSKSTLLGLLLPQGFSMARISAALIFQAMTRLPFTFQNTYGRS